MVTQTPLLFLGDAPSLDGGLSRIGRDLAFTASRMDEFRVGFLGRGGGPTRKLPFMQYNFPETEQWGEVYLEPVWKDFAGSETGIVMTIWDPSRLLWFANPMAMPNESWLRGAPFQRWGYFAVDHEGVGGRLTAVSAEVVRSYDRVLAYGEFGAQVLGKTLGHRVEWVPHGINMDIFKPRDGGGARAAFGIGKDSVLVGCVMTNQARKDWGLAFETVALLKRWIPGLRAWFKVDAVDRHWDLRALTADFELADTVLIDIGVRSDEEMSYMYSACDVTFLPSLGEGFGYPIVESLACGVPCVHGEYAGGADLVSSARCRLWPKAFRWDTRYNCKRPVFDAEDWASTLKCVVGDKLDEDSPEACRASVEHLDWGRLHTVWERWFEEGLEPRVFNICS